MSAGKEPPLKSAYFFYGGDTVKIASARRRLADRAERDGAMLEQLKGDRCSPDDVATAIVSPSLLGGRRIVLADGVAGWRAADVQPVADAIASLTADASGDDTIVVLIGDKKPLAAIEKAIVAVGGEVREFKAPTAKAMPKWVRDQAKAMGVELDPDAAQLMVDMAGAERPQYLLSELQKLATYVGQDAHVARDDVAAAGTGEAVPKVFALSDAALEGDTFRALGLARDLLDGGERPHGILFALARSFSQAQQAAAVLDSGGDVAEALGISPWLAGKVTAAARMRGEQSLQDAIVALAEFDRDTKGGNALDDETNLVTTLTQIAA